MSVWTNDEIIYLKSNYYKYTKKELAKQLNKTENAIQVKARRVGLKKKSKYYYRKEYFDNIKTPNQAYWLGFIYADGYVSQEKKKPSTYTVGIEVSLKDKKHLQNFNNDICGNIGITTRHRKNNYHGKNIEGDLCVIRMYCSEMAQDLIGHGCCLNKSLIKGCPVGVPAAYMRDFIRGYFDGNGSIAYSLNKKVMKSYLKVTIESGSKNFVEWLSTYLLNKKIVNNFYKDGERCFKLQIASKSAKHFLGYIYDNSERYLNRKYEKYLVAVYGDDTTAINHYGAKSVKA